MPALEGGHKIAALRNIRSLPRRYVNIGEPECIIATDAYAQYGKGRHPAALNMSDCYAYACARSNQARLLFTGDDFGKTGITAA